MVPTSPEPSKCGECSRTSKISDEDNIPGACDLKEELQIPARVFRRLTVMTSGTFCGEREALWEGATGQH